MSSPYLAGFSKENLLRGLVAAIVVASITLLFVEPIVMLLDANFGPSQILSPFLLWAALLLIWFVLITLFHAALHAFFAFVFERGETAFEAGDFDRAVRYLRWFTYAHCWRRCSTSSATRRPSGSRAGAKNWDSRRIWKPKTEPILDLRFWILDL